jgi:hypothetical protein
LAKAVASFGGTQKIVAAGSKLRGSCRLGAHAAVIIWSSEKLPRSLKYSEVDNTSLFAVESVT